MVTYTEFEVGGRPFVMARSDRGMKIAERNTGALYDEAAFPKDVPYEFDETDTPISLELTEADKDAALRRFGVEV